MLGLVYWPPRTAARESACPERSRRAHFLGATAHWAVFEPLGLRIEPFRGLGLLLWVQESVQARSGLVRAQELQQPGLAIRGLAVMLQGQVFLPRFYRIAGLCLARMAQRDEPFVGGLFGGVEDALSDCSVLG